jgi:hypothetical protein
MSASDFALLVSARLGVNFAGGPLVNAFPARGRRGRFGRFGRRHIWRHGEAMECGLGDQEVPRGQALELNLLEGDQRDMGKSEMNWKYSCYKRCIQYRRKGEKQNKARMQVQRVNSFEKQRKPRTGTHDGTGPFDVAIRRARHGHRDFHIFSIRGRTLSELQTRGGGLSAATFTKRHGTVVHMSTLLAQPSGFSFFSGKHFQEGARRAFDY